MYKIQDQWGKIYASGIINSYEANRTKCQCASFYAGKGLEFFVLPE